MFGTWFALILYRLGAWQGMSEPPVENFDDKT